MNFFLNLFVTAKMLEKGVHPLDMVLLWGAWVGTMGSIGLAKATGDGWFILWAIICGVAGIFLAINFIRTLMSD